MIGLLCFALAVLASPFKGKDMSHVRGAPNSGGKIERWRQTLNNRILLENYYLPVDLEQQINAFVKHYNHVRYHESIDNLTPPDVGLYSLARHPFS
jgi:RNA-directed DNA polymerase